MKNKNPYHVGGEARSTGGGAERGNQSVCVDEPRARMYLPRKLLVGPGKKGLMPALNAGWNQCECRARTESSTTVPISDLSTFSALFGSGKVGTYLRYL